MKVIAEIIFKGSIVFFILWLFEINKWQPNMGKAITFFVIGFSISAIINAFSPKDVKLDANSYMFWLNMSIESFFSCGFAILIFSLLGMI